MKKILILLVLFVASTAQAQNVKQSLIGLGMKPELAHILVGVKSIVPAGSAQSDATLISGFTVKVTTADGIKGIRLPVAAVIGNTYTIMNYGSAAVILYPATNGSIGTNGTNVSVSLAGFSMTTCRAVTTLAWVCGEAAAA